ncbi:MAG: iron donor protein CyaY [Oligoflexia bacterium]|nr:iron donor protein CyaY [Oligoflexia bacterium]
MTETEYRKWVQEIFERIEKPLMEIDPDLIEAEKIQGALTLAFADRTKCILSAQPSVRQLWLALASEGTAYHFSYDPARKQWIDDKGLGVELLGFLESFLEKKSGVRLRFGLAGQSTGTSPAEVTVFTTDSCPYCSRAKDLLQKRGVPFREVRVSWDDDGQWDALYRRSGMKTVPQIYAGDRLIGGYTELAKLDESDGLVSLKGGG